MQPRDVAATPPLSLHLSDSVSAVFESKANKMSASHFARWRETVDRSEVKCTDPWPALLFHWTCGTSEQRHLPMAHTQCTTYRKVNNKSTHLHQKPSIWQTNITKWNKCFSTAAQQLIVFCFFSPKSSSIPVQRSKTSQKYLCRDRR